jgi:hypothetical protein
VAFFLYRNLKQFHDQQNCSEKPLKPSTGSRVPPRFSSLLWIVWKRTWPRFMWYPVGAVFNFTKWASRMLKWAIDSVERRLVFLQMATRRPDCQLALCEGKNFSYLLRKGTC